MDRRIFLKAIPALAAFPGVLYASVDSESGAKVDIDIASTLREAADSLATYGRWCQVNSDPAQASALIKLSAECYRKANAGEGVRVVEWDV